MRPTRKKIKFDLESVNGLLQEIYNDSHNIKSKINRLFLKWESKVKNDDEIATIGDQIVKLIQAEARNQDQKITLLKYLKDAVFDTKEDNKKLSDETNDDEKISLKRRNDLLKLVEDELNRKQVGIKNQDNK